MPITRRNLTLGASLSAATLLTLAAFTAGASAEITVGSAAPGFTATTASGETINLADFAGGTVVLEWTNHDCPYVRKHYNGNAMQALQARANAEDITWIQVISSAPGEQGHVSAAQALALNTERGATPDHVVLDESGDIGRLYDARTTPHMYIIDAAGALRYAGAIDDQPSARPSSLEGAYNYVTASLDALASGLEIDPSQTVPYGCSVKY